jgi:hypothetical protein
MQFRLGLQMLGPNTLGGASVWQSGGEYRTPTFIASSLYVTEHHYLFSTHILLPRTGEQGNNFRGFPE